MAAIVSDPCNAEPIEMLQFKHTHFTTTQIRTAIGDIHLVSVYFQYGHEIGPYLDHLEFILTRLRNKHVLVGGDVNARSILWHNQETDERGEELEQHIFRHDLEIINSEGQPSTHVAGGNIDVTLASRSLARHVVNWRVLVDQSISDHRLITYDINRIPYENNAKHMRMLVRDTNFQTLNQLLEQRHALINNEDQTKESIKSMHNNLEEACKYVIPRKPVRPRTVPWWNANLDKKKRVMNRKRRQFQRCCPCPARVQFRDEYRLIRQQYKEEVYEAKRSSWKNFVQENSNRDPYGLV